MLTIYADQQRRQLTIARRIVEAHGGRTWAASQPGQGTTISFSLPLGQMVECRERYDVVRGA